MAGSLKCVCDSFLTRAVGQAVGPGRKLARVNFHYFPILGRASPAPVLTLGPPIWSGASLHRARSLSQSSQGATTNYQTGWLEQWKSISHSSAGWQVRDQASIGSHASPLPGVQTIVFLWCPHRGERKQGREGQRSKLSPYNSTNPIIFHPHDLITKALNLNTITLGLAESFYKKKRCNSIFPQYNQPGKFHHTQGSAQNPFAHSYYQKSYW